MKARKIMIIRHAEKPYDTGTPSGVDIDGNQDTESLTPRGWQRAGALAEFFASPKSQDIAVPQYLYSSGIGQHSNSMRPQETITPLAERLGLDINTRYLKGQETKVVNDAMKFAGVVLLSWEHQNIHLIANQIMGNETSVPQAWPEDRFDIVWVFDFNAGSYVFSQVPQLLLAGDKSFIIT